MEKKVSIKDIAKYVGVSTALVSYVLNNKEKEARVGKQMAEKVRRAAVKFNYRPNLIARSLQSGKTQTLGLIVADISNPFFSNVARVIEDNANRHGYTVIIGSSDEKASKSHTLVDAFLNRQVDGLIIAPAQESEKQVQQLLANKIPFVLVDRYLEGVTANSVHIDNYQSAYDAVVHLVENGYRRISMLGYQSPLPHMQQRIKGYQDALREKGIRAKKNWLLRVDYDSIEEAVPAGLETLMKHRSAPDAFFFATNSLAVTALRYIHRKGYRVPEDLGLVSFDESDAFDFFYAPVTYVKQRIDEIGKRAVDLLIQQISNPKLKKEEVIIPTRLVVRESSTRAKVRSDS